MKLKKGKSEAEGVGQSGAFFERWGEGGALHFA
jgi:hypothetical protein